MYKKFIQTWLGPRACMISSGLDLVHSFPILALLCFCLLQAQTYVQLATLATEEHLYHRHSKTVPKWSYFT